MCSGSGSGFGSGSGPGLGSSSIISRILWQILLLVDSHGWA